MRTAQVGLLDFGQVKELPPGPQALYAALVVAMARRDEALIRACMRAAGVVVENCSPRFEAVAGMIMFDTRMDFPEARMAPTDAAAHEFRCANGRTVAAAENRCRASRSRSGSPLHLG